MSLIANYEIGGGRHGTCALPVVDSQSELQKLLWNLQLVSEVGTILWDQIINLWVCTNSANSRMISVRIGL